MARGNDQDRGPAQTSGIGPNPTPAGPPRLGVSNQRFKLVRALSQRKHRQASGLTVLEGTRLIETAVAAGAHFELMLVTSEALAAASPLLAGRLDVETYLVDAGLFERLSLTSSPQGVLAVIRTPRPVWPEPPYPPETVFLCLDGVSDPGNAGSLIRVADAAGAAGVLTLGGTDPWSPKCLRAGMGSTFHLPVIDLEAGSPAQLELYFEGCRIIAASPSDGTSIWESDLSGPCALVLGNEAWGLSNLTRRRANQLVTIPMFGRAESLNVAQAGAIALYEIARHNRLAGLSTAPPPPA